jgi:LCP family protein required for cell wall assembly
VPARRNYQKPTPKPTIRAVNQRRTRSGQRGRWLLIWFALTGVAMLSATAGALLAVSINATPLRQAEMTSQEEAVFFRQGKTISRGTLRFPELTRPVNILVMGTKVLTSEVYDPDQTDLGYHALVNSFDGLADTMLLVSFNPQTEKVTVLSLPRDTQVRMGEYGVQKINAANSYGGPALAAKVTSELLEDIPIDRYVRVNVQGVEKLIDALGGVTVHVPKDMKYTDESQHLYIDLKAGKQHLDGDKALQFLRYRYDRYGDIGRVQRQQMMMRALSEQALNPSIVTKVPKILAVIQSNIDTNLSVEELVALVGFSTQIERDNIEMLMLPGNFSSDGRTEVSYWLPDQEEIQQMMAQQFDRGYIETKLKDKDVGYQRIAIQDTTGDDEAVARLVARLERAGYRNIYRDRAWSDTIEITRIVAQGGDQDNARMVQSLLGLGEVRVESTGALRSDVTIQLGKDWLRN